MTKQKLRKIIGENIRNQRKLRNLSTDELAELMGLSPGFIGLIERGERGATTHNIMKLSEIFNVPVDTFITAGTGEPKKTSVVTKRERIGSLIVDLNDHELEFVISTIKSLKNLRNASQTDNE